MSSIAIAYPQNVTGNLSLNINDGNGTLLFPGGNTTFNTTNLSFHQLFNLTAEFPDRLNLTLNLSRGENRTMNGTFDNLTLYCTNETFLVYNQTFNISASIKRGETYNATVGSCNVQVACSGSCADNVSYEVNQQVSLQKVGNELTITSQNNTKTFNWDITNASDTITLTYYCPKDINDVVTLDNDTQMRIAYDFCQQQFPVMNEWLNLTLNRCSDNWQAYRDFVTTHNDGVIRANQELSNALSRVSSLETEKELQNNRVRDLQNEVLAERDRTDGREVIIALQMFIIIGCITVIFIMRYAGDEVGH